MKARVLASGGIFPGAVLPETDQINYAPRSTLPTLMINGRYDFLFLEPGQRRLFPLLGAPPQDKEYVQIEAGHIVRRDLIEKDVAHWLDRHLGPVK